MFIKLKQASSSYANTLPVDGQCAVKPCLCSWKNLFLSITSRFTSSWTWILEVIVRAHHKLQQRLSNSDKVNSRAENIPLPSCRSLSLRAYLEND